MRSLVCIHKLQSLTLRQPKFDFNNTESLIGDNRKSKANAIIMGPLKLGHNVTIGAGAVVTKDFDNNCTLIGIPAKQAKK